MTRTTRLVPLGLAVTLLLSACSGGDGTPAATSDSGVPLVAEGKLTVCTNPPYEPFEYTDDSGEIVGLDIDIVNEIAADLGVEPEIKVAQFEGIQSGADLETGNCDLVASAITITEERAARIDFSEPYFDADQGLLLPAAAGVEPMDEEEALASLEGSTIGVQQETTGAAWATENGLTTIEFEDLGLQVQALENGQVNAIINDVAVLGPFVEDGYTFGATFTTGEQYGFGVKKGNTALLDAVNGTLERIQGDGTYDAIYTERIGDIPTAD
ncbi:transporter substrate-binding domain-containing protein [Cellulomonas sp. 179-A 4D5 NHS]|uniref:transporter substrate-binding domain-containing protein n=1 Tax=Cellulomonas sp. 179-A 4D5 NHS TaxID=3142378 RepID=UPI0039A37C33